MFLSCRPFVAITTVVIAKKGLQDRNIYIIAGMTVVIATKGLQDRNIYIIAGTTVENKGKFILTEIFPSVRKHDIF